MATAAAELIDAGRLTKSVRDLEKKPPVRRERLTTLLKYVNHMIDLLELNWRDLPKEFRDIIKVGTYLVVDKPHFYERIGRSLWSYLFVLRYARDREALVEYFKTAARLEETLFDLIEQDSDVYTRDYVEAIETHADRASGVEGRLTREDWHAWLRDL